MSEYWKKQFSGMFHQNHGINLIIEGIRFYSIKELHSHLIHIKGAKISYKTLHSRLQKGADTFEILTKPTSKCGGASIACQEKYQKRKQEMAEIIRQLDERKLQMRSAA